MQTIPDAEVGHILTNLYGSIRASPPAQPHHYNTNTNQIQNNQTLTPSSSAPTPSQNFQPISTPPAGNQLSSALKRSRSRPTKSCEECRRKKLKCDRELPCSNCKKGGRDGSTCFFKDGPGTETERQEKRVRIEDVVSPQRDLQQEQREKERERQERYPHLPPFVRAPGIGEPGRGILAFGMNGVAPVPAWNDIPVPESMAVLGHEQRESVGGANWSGTAKALGRVHVKGTRSRYVGIGDRMAMLDHFEDSKGFILRSFKDPEMAGMIHELAAYQNAFQPKHKPQHVIPLDRDELMVEMMKALPSGLLFGILQARYISNWETIWRVLHIGTFMKECDHVAQIRESGSFTLPPGVRDSVVPQILAIVSAATRLNDLNNRGSTTERVSDDQTSKNCQMVKAWLDSLHGKALVNFHTLQTRTLLLLAHQANLATPQELWVESGILVRHAMVMGLHLDPEPWDAISKFDKEQKRKLWMTIVELDLQFSLGAGMPSLLSSNSLNMRELLNVDDHDLSEDMTEYPASKPLTVWTHALPQIALGASLRDRLQIVNTLGGNLNLERDARTLLHYASLLENALLSLPPPLRASTRAGTASNKRLYRLFTSITIDVSLRRPLMMLYRIIYMSPFSQKYPEARKGALRNALAILSHLDALDPSVADLNIVKTRDYLNLFCVLRKNDILQAALVLCYEIKSYNSRSDGSTATFNDRGEEEDDHQEGAEDSFPQTQYSLTRVVENTLNSLIQRLGEFGSDLKDILPVSVALQAVRSDGSQEEKKVLMVKGAERVLEACRRARPEISLQHKAELEINQQNGNQQNGRSENVGRESEQRVVNPFWNLETGQKNAEVQNRGVLSYDEFNLIPDDNLGFENLDLDFGFFDWGGNQSWL